MRKLLIRHGFSCQIPAKRTVERDEGAICGRLKEPGRARRTVAGAHGCAMLKDGNRSTHSFQVRGCPTPSLPDSSSHRREAPWPSTSMWTCALQTTAIPAASSSST
ncbi:winged helix-turn-helix domain-containing protein [Streptomyces sp. NPDC058476]|uniref:winged helix-turn-helix domain-containing protein n=1 Tax=Streptomyces sp. NPDC058476 TaxID=3346519 RepID=UPI0036637037